MDHWSDEELIARFEHVKTEFLKKSEIVIPLMQKMHSLELEMLAIQKEYLRRGLNSDKETGQ